MCSTCTALPGATAWACSPRAPPDEPGTGTAAVVVDPDPDRDPTVWACSTLFSQADTWTHCSYEQTV